MDGIGRVIEQHHMRKNAAGLERRAAHRLRDRAKHLSAAHPVTTQQAAVVGVVCILLSVSLIIAPDVTDRLVALLAAGWFLSLAAFRLVLMAAAWRIAPVVVDAQRTDWPVYTVIVPMYREGRILPRLMQRLEALDYPRDRLDLILAIEARDEETHQALSHIHLPPHVRVLRLPDGAPRTKPKACTAALALAFGQYVTIYDAEDAPHPQQLKAAVTQFEAGDRRLACLQAPLDIYNHRDSFLSQQFALEYATHFHVMLPGMVKLGLPIALGGTSNHFRVDALRRVGGWDPYNVTEDADLGLRMAAFGYRCGYLPLPTREEAPVTLGVWVRQRSRWIKGFMQTYGVHMRHPHRLWRRTGWRGLLSLHASIAATIVASVVHAPLVLTLIGASGLALWRGHPPAPLALWVLGGCFAVWLLSVHLAARRVQMPHMVWHALLSPLYWPLHSLAAVRAIMGLIRNPFHWEKTPHGVALAPDV